MTLFLFLLIFGEFGYNKIQYKNFKWESIETEHFTIIYQKGSFPIGKFASSVLEKHYKRLEEIFGKLERKVPVIIYNSHIDFQQTNVIPLIIEEEIGGFTEFFKNRICVPFDGSYANLKRVLQHELTHVFQSKRETIPLQEIFQTIRYPLWWIEGTAEYLGEGWSPEAEAFLADLIYNEKLKPLTELSEDDGYLLYKEGQSFVKFIAERYGEKKIGEIHRLIPIKGMNGALKATIGLGLKQAQKLWKEHLKEIYWKKICTKEEIPKEAKRLTRHKRNFFNIAPAISPDGKLVAFLSDRKYSHGIYLLSTTTGEIKRKIAKGGRKGGFESLHMMRGRLAFSKDGKIAFIAQKNGKDVLYIYSIKRKKIILKKKFKMDEIYHPYFSPDGKEIVFRGIKSGKADIYIYDIEKDIIRRLTNDIFDDRTPSFSQDGKWIYFASDRPDKNWNPGFYTIYRINREGKIEKVLPLRAKVLENPIEIKGEIIFCADFDGVSNIYSYKDGKFKKITNLIGGVGSFSLTPDGKWMAFSCYNNMGWDIFLMKEPLEKGKEIKVEEKKPEEELVEVQFEKKKFENKLTTDFGGGGFTFTFPAGGYYGQMYGQISDILGNICLQFFIHYISEDINSITIALWNLRRRTDYGIGFQKISDVFLEEESNYLYNIHLLTYLSLSLLLEYPFSKFERLEGLLSGYYLYDEIYLYDYKNDAIMDADTFSIVSPYLYLALVKDNSIWSNVGPMLGERGKIWVSANLGKNIIYGADLRKYLLFEKFTFALRFNYLKVEGKEGWDKITVSSERLRAIRDYYTECNKLVSLNSEIRFPFIKLLYLSFPEIKIRNIRGALICDAGFIDEEPLMAIGFGIRLPFLLPVIRVELLWEVDTKTFSIRKEGNPFWRISSLPEF